MPALNEWSADGHWFVSFITMKKDCRQPAGAHCPCEKTVITRFPYVAPGAPCFGGPWRFDARAGLCPSLISLQDVAPSPERGDRHRYRASLDADDPRPQGSAPEQSVMGKVHNGRARLRRSADAGSHPTG